MKQPALFLSSSVTLGAMHRLPWIMICNLILVCFVGEFCLLHLGPQTQHLLLFFPPLCLHLPSPYCIPNA